MPLKRMKRSMIWSTIVIEGDFVKMGTGKDLDADNASVIVGVGANVDAAVVIIADRIMDAHVIVIDAVTTMKEEYVPIFTKMRKKSSLKIHWTLLTSKLLEEFL